MGSSAGAMTPGKLHQTIKTRRNQTFDNQRRESACRLMPQLIEAMQQVNILMKP